MNPPSGCDSTHLAAPVTALAPTFIILAMALCSLVLGSFTLGVFIVLVAVHSFWWRFVHFGSSHQFGGRFIHFVGSLIGAVIICDAFWVMYYNGVY